MTLRSETAEVLPEESADRAQRSRQDIRLEELHLATPWFPPASAVLELGGGSGYHASVLDSWGWAVTSLDIPTRRKPARQYFPVGDYDGRHIPFPADSFDVVFSSSVLPHVDDLPALLAEVDRVVKPGGTIVHLVPSASWRVWTCVTHYLRLPALVGDWMSRHARRRVEPSPKSSSMAVAPTGAAAGRLRSLLVPAPVGLYPNAFVELFRCRRSKWRLILADDDAQILLAAGTKIFYTGHLVAPRLVDGHRHVLARWLGSSSHLFVLRVRDAA